MKIGVLVCSLLACALTANSVIIPVYNTNNAFAGSLRQAIQDVALDGTTVVRSRSGQIIP